jgi:hypothetical protein
VHLAWPSDFSIFLADEELSAGMSFAQILLKYPAIFVLHTALYYTAAEQVYTAY